MAKIISRNPATGETLKELETTPSESLSGIMAKAKTAQEKWAAMRPKERAQHLYSLREVIINRVDEISELIAKENGKPRFEAMANEIIPSVDLISFFAKRGPRALRDHKIPMVLMKHRSSRIQYWPLGVVAIISPWNYPFLLPMGEIVMALIAGNSVVFKPSEVTPLIGLKIQELFEEAGFPDGVMQTIVGDGSLGAALIQNKPAKIFFTGSVATGKKIMAAAAEHLIPVNLELGGKDAMIVLSDADLDYATSAALWGGFSNSGQMCASVERLIVHESIAKPFFEKLSEKMNKLTPRDKTSLDGDLGAVTFENQKKVYEKHLSDARAKGAAFVTGGEFSADRCALKPTLVTGTSIESTEIYNEETFGPVIAATTFKTIDEAIEKANRSRYGLLASIITKDLARAEQIAKRLEVGTVTINEVAYTAGLAETPWGGVKESGIGRSHSEAGLFEFVNSRHIHRPRSSALVFKSFWWFPYTPFQYATFRSMIEMYRRSWFGKLKALPHFLWNFVQFMKNEKRL